MLESVLYKGTSKTPLLFYLVLRLHQVHMRGELILHLIQIVGTRMIEAGIDDISRGNMVEAEVEEIILPSTQAKFGFMEAVGI